MRLDGVLRVPAAACVLTARSDSLAFSSYGRRCTNGCVRFNANATLMMLQRAFNHDDRACLLVPHSSSPRP